MRQIADMAGDEIELGRPDHADGDVGLAHQQVLDRIGRHDFELDIRIGAADRHQQFGQDIMGEHVARRDADRAGQFHRLALGNGPRLAERAVRRPHRLVEPEAPPRSASAP